MNKICCFAGHSRLDNPEEVRKKLTSAVEKLITEENVTEFLVGNYGEFDRLAAGVLKNLKNQYPHIEVNLTIPYLVSNIDKQSNDFDDIIIANMPESTPRGLRIIKCNEYMVDKSDFVVCYVNCTWGGAYQTTEYAKRKSKTVINLA